MKENISPNRREFLKKAGEVLLGAKILGGDNLLPTEEEQRLLALRGSKEALDAENALATKYNLARIEKDGDGEKMITSGLLIKIERNYPNFYVDEIGINNGVVYPGNRDLLYVARPWVKDFLDAEAALFAQAFPGIKFKVTALTRSGEYQEWLREFNVNASDRSTHLTGSSVDISKFLRPSSVPGKDREFMSKEQLVYMQRRLSALERAGRILATEEHTQGTFHIFVTPDYPRPKP